MATTLIQHVQAQERNINDLFNDRKEILEFQIGRHHFNKPIFEHLDKIEVNRTYHLIQSLLRLEVFQRVINFEGNRPIQTALTVIYNDIALNYNLKDRFSLMGLGDDIDGFSSLLYTHHFGHNLQRINQNLPQ